MDTGRLARRLCTAAVGIGCAFSLPAWGTLITNGDFEACANGLAPAGGTLVAACGWTFFDNAGVEGSGGNPGKKVRLESNGLPTRDPTAAQTVSGLTIGGQYTLEWDLGLRAALQSGSGRSFGVFLDTQTFASSLFLGEQLTTPYQHYSVTFTATAASHTIIFAGELDSRSNGLSTPPGNDTDVSYNLDNVSLNVAAAQAPEPATAVLFAMGLLLALRATRASRRLSACAVARPR